MEKANKKVWMVLVFLITLCSCSNEYVNIKKFLKTIVETSADGTSQTTFFTYNGDEIVSVDGVYKHTDFTYTDDQITKIVELDKATQVRNTVEYSYAKGQLMRAEALNNYRINYIHNSDGSVSYEKLALDSGNQEVKEFHGILYFQNENLIKDERILDNTAVGVVSNYSISFEYDSEHNPFRNILGYEKLLDHNETISLNNSTIITVITSTTKDGQISSSAKFYKRSFKYDLENYPIEQVSENTLLNNGNYGYLKSQYFYE